MAGKRGNGEGSIRQRADGSWEARINLGGLKRKSFYGQTRTEVAVKLAAATRDRDRGLPITRDERQTVEKYLATWLETVRPPKLAQTTWERYHDYCCLHLNPTLGKTSLAKLTPQQVQELYAAKLSEGLSSTTVHHLHAVLHRALESALRLGIVPRNVTELVDAPRMVRPEMKVWTPEHAKTFLATAESDRLFALYVVALSTGMRQGELLGLRWTDIDLDRASLSVAVNLQRPRTGLKMAAKPKTRTSRRRIALTTPTAAALREHRGRQLEERLKLGELWTDHNLVFPNQHGAPLRNNNLWADSFIPLVAKAGVPPIRFHDLRHSCATILLLQGVNPKIVSEMLGHASVAITLDLYSHVLPDMQAQAARAMEAALWG